MPITEIRIEAVEPFAEGHAFGDVGPYVRIRGVAHGELDPAAPENAGIVDLDKAPRNARGLVEYSTDIFVLRPAEPARGSGILVYDVTNRGAKRILSLLDDVPANDTVAVNDPKNLRDAGLGFSFGRGYSIVWSGWDPGAPRANHGLGAEFPDAVENGRPIIRRIRDEFHVGTRGPSDGTTHRLPYPAASTDPRAARLAVRDRESDPRTDISPAEWEFVDERTIRLSPEGRKFEPFRIYELWYEATGAKVLGIGHASVRDLVSHLRYDRTEAIGGDVRHALGFGVSQSGRFLRHFLELGMNKDSRGRRVFDGVFSHVAGAGKVFANHRFGMPGRTATQHEDRLYPENWFPFSTARLTDRFSGHTDALLRARPTDPVVIETNTSTEYWQKGASLIHTDPVTGRDAELPPNARAYLIAGTQHGGRPGVDPRPGLCANPRNAHSATPMLRALFAALEDWVTEGAEPPPSRVPSIAEGTAVAAETIRLPRVPGFALAPGANRIGPPVDWADPPDGGPAETYVTVVAAVDADGNETAGIRSPSIAVPLGTHTGWNVYKAQPLELADRDGSFIALARNKIEREAADDPRPSLARALRRPRDYVARVRKAADALVAERLLLPADADAYVKAAEAAICSADPALPGLSGWFFHLARLRGAPALPAYADRAASKRRQGGRGNVSLDNRRHAASEPPCFSRHPRSSPRRS